jgi:hypothetical protein
MVKVISEESLRFNNDTVAKASFCLWGSPVILPDTDWSWAWIVKNKQDKKNENSKYRIDFDLHQSYSRVAGWSANQDGYMVNES